MSAQWAQTRGMTNTVKAGFKAVNRHPVTTNKSERRMMMMMTIGIDPSPTAFTLAALSSDGTCTVRSLLSHHGTLDFITKGPQEVRLVVIETGHPVHKEHMTRLIDALKEERIPVVTVNVQIWRKQLGISLKPKTS